jgi:hypothetical protein
MQTIKDKLFINKINNLGEAFQRLREEGEELYKKNKDPEVKKGIEILLDLEKEVW